MATQKLRIAGDTEKALPTKQALTDARVKAATCKAGETRRTIYDTATPGLALNVTATGAKAFYWYGRVKGMPTPVRFHIADAATMNVTDARTEARDIGAKAARGIDPRESRKQAKEAARTAISVGELWKRYREERLVPSCSPSTLRTDDSRWKLHLSTWENRPIQSITREDVAELHRAITVNKNKGPNIADKTVKLLRRLLTFAKIQPNPAAGGAVEFHGDDQRERFLSQDELGRVIVELERCANTTIADAIRFALLTGARRGNVCGARWQDVHTDRGLWIIPKDQSKNGKPMTIALAPDAVALIERRREDVAAWLKRRQKRYGLDKPESCAYIFPGRTPEAPINEVKSTWDKIREAAKVPDVHFHDLRHTLASWMAMQGASLLQIGKQLGHANKQSTARYSHLELDSVRPATNAAVAAMFGPKAPKADAK